MCNEILVINGGQEIVCSNISELISATGLDVKTIYPESDGIYHPRECLCSVDAEELGGRMATEDEGWPFIAYVIEESAIKALKEAEDGGI